jgi:hypothetical protein
MATKAETENTELTIFDRYTTLSGDTALIQEVLAENLAGEQLGVQDLPQIKVPTGGATSWEVPTPSGPQPMRSLDAIILLTTRQRAFWTSQLAQQGTPPSCTSDDCLTGQGDNGQGQGTHDCIGCPQDEWGTRTAPDGSEARGKACRETRVFYLLLPDLLLPAALRVPATSLRGSREYLLQLATAGLIYHQVVTRFSLERVQNAAGQPYSRVVLQQGPTLPQDVHVRMRGLVAFYKPQLQRLRARDMAETYSPDETDDAA